ncbi:hypothetical protein CA236_05965 [Sphingomonas sp. ABOLG]|nr:hypothetical protein CA236_05965 [Sphingomonas sp. ABOLG]
MVTVLSFAVFAGTLGVSIYALVVTIAPRMDRIIGALRGQPAHRHPLATLVRAEQRIAVRRWAATPVRSAPSSSRAAA